jgi:nitrogen fixation/metabolism regulation signal transduction histidine kinase
LPAIARGLAHEIRNPLHAIRLNFHAIARVSQGSHFLLSEHERQQVVTESANEIRRISALLDDFICLATPHHGQPKPLDLAGIVREAVRTVKQEWRHDTLRIRMELHHAQRASWVDAAAMHEAMIRLLTFFDARLQGTGTLLIRLVASGATTEIAFCDDGPKLSEDELRTIFEPFSPAVHRSSGLALPIVRRIVLEAGGQVTWKNQDPTGLEIRLLLPSESLSYDEHEG